jgi:RNA polymerase sigma factor (sigma-70 family)
MAEIPESLDDKIDDNPIAGAERTVCSSDDAKVIRSILEGAVNDFELLVHRYKGKIGRIVAPRVRPGDVEDVTQQTFVRAFKALGSFGGRAPFENWLSKLAVHCCYDYWRRQQREDARVVQPGKEENYQVWIDRVSAVFVTVGKNSLNKTAEIGITTSLWELVDQDVNTYDVNLFDETGKAKEDIVK